MRGVSGELGGCVCGAVVDDAGPQNERDLLAASCFRLPAPVSGCPRFSLQSAALLGKSYLTSRSRPLCLLCTLTSARLPRSTDSFSWSNSLHPGKHAQS